MDDAPSVCESRDVGVPTRLGDDSRAFSNVSGGTSLVCVYASREGRLLREDGGAVEVLLLDATVVKSFWLISNQLLSGESLPRPPVV